ncbi:WXG100 family type VII secretion target [Streptomyces sp. NPDC048416]|uniref:WXG100 family type VII secretion target n=1 Tax=Streptomyces sp. NPDC048416 TaxID=3365546 RepID=UPI003711ACBF
MSDYSGDVLGVTYSSLEEAAAAIKQQAGQLDDDLREIKSLVDKAAGSWHGEAHEVYVTNQQEWDKRARSIQTSLAQIANAVADAGPTYRAGDHKAAGYFQ